MRTLAGDVKAPCGWPTSRSHRGSFPLRALLLLPETPDEEIEEGRKNERDEPAPNETLDEAEKECRPAQEFEAWQEDAKRLVLYWEVWKHQVADDANHIENYEEKAQTQSERHHWNISCTAARCGHGDLPPGKGRCNVRRGSPRYFAPGCICLGCICPGPCPGIIAIIPIPIWGARSSLAVFFWSSDNVP